MAIRKKHIRALVDNILREQNINRPKVPVRHIAKSFGIEVKLDDVRDTLSGFLVRNSETGKTVIGVNKAHSESRRRFTIAHELGHYLLHEGELVHLDTERPGFRVNLRSDHSPRDSEMEREANLFAAELLMPARFLEKDIKLRMLDLLEEKSDDVLREVAKKYGVSVQALTYRLANLGLIDATD